MSHSSAKQLLLLFLVNLYLHLLNDIFVMMIKEVSDAEKDQEKNYYSS